MKSTWKKYLLYSAYLLIGIGILYGLSKLILAGYSVSWTGFGESTLSNGNIVGEKTLWDWMELLIIPLVLALGAFFLNRSERATERDTAEKRSELEREIAKDRQQEAALQTYFDRMSDLLLKEKLRTTKKKEVRDVARTRTISILRALDTERSNLVINFLREARVVTEKNSILNKADLKSMNLRNLDLQNVYLQGASLEQANLERAKLWDVNLQDAILVYASLQHAQLWAANLQGANLQWANLQGASLQRANLKGAILVYASLQMSVLHDADLQAAYLEQANLEGAYLERANLEGAYLQQANLEGANLQQANLEGANLQYAQLWAANLEQANLEGANLEEAILQGAQNITESQLAKVKSLKGAIMPDGTIHE